MRKIAPFLRGQTWWGRVPRIGEGLAAVQRSLGVSDEAEAREVCRFLEWLRARGARSAYLLDAMALGSVPVLDGYKAYLEHALDAFEDRLRHGIADPNLEPYVAKWDREMERRKKPNPRTRARYVREVRTLLVAGEVFPRSAFTRQRIRDWLSELPVEQPNRYRAALSGFARYLVFEDVLDANPVQLVPMAREADPRSTHLTIDEAEQLAAALAQPHRALHALMMATGMELGAALALRRSDVTDDATPSAYARGTKREHRKRMCTVYWRWADFWQRHVTTYLAEAKQMPAALVFPGVSQWEAYRAMKTALANEPLAALPQDYRVHDHRHTWAVQAVRDGLALHTIAAQLGHRDAMMVLKVYGRFKPTTADFGARPVDPQQLPQQPPIDRSAAK